MIFDDITNYIKCINLGYYPSKGKITNLIIKQMNYISNDILNVPEEYKEIYNVLLNKLNSLGEDVLKECMSYCKCEHQTLMNCWYMFQSLLAARQLNMTKHEKTYLKYIKEQLKIK